MAHGQAGLHSAAVQPVHGQAGGEGDEAGRPRVQGSERADGGWKCPVPLPPQPCYCASDEAENVDASDDCATLLDLYSNHHELVTQGTLNEAVGNSLASRL